MLLSLLQTNVAVGIAYILALVLGISIHEFAHALGGYLQGDMTARDAGRLTLNPLAHLDPMGSIAMLFLPIGWGKSTPYNPYNLRNQKWGPLIVSLCGPLSNMIGALTAAILFNVLAPFYGIAGFSAAVGLLDGQGNFLMIFLVFFYLINIMLMIFNLLPIPPLDGAQIVLTGLPDSFRQFKQFLVRSGPVILIAFVILNSYGQIGIFNVVFDYCLGFLFGRFA
jgi:Zn-dependent protease